LRELAEGATAAVAVEAAGAEAVEAAGAEAADAEVAVAAAAAAVYRGELAASGARLETLSVDTQVLMSGFGFGITDLSVVYRAAHAGGCVGTLVGYGCGGARHIEKSSRAS
jgi:hypothetical protein